MKYFNIELGKNSAGELQYPANYNTFNKHIVDHLYYDANDKTNLLVVCKDESDGMMDGVSGVTELTSEEAKTLADVHDPSDIEKITDTAKIERLKIKSALGVALTDDELKAIDPDDATPGIGKNKRLSRRIEDLEAK